MEFFLWVFVFSHDVLIKEFSKHLLIFLLGFINKFFENFDVFHMLEENQAGSWVKIEDKIIYDESLHKLTKELNDFLLHVSNDSFFDTGALKHILFIVKNHVIADSLFFKMTSNKCQSFFLEQRCAWDFVAD